MRVSFLFFSILLTTFSFANPTNEEVIYGNVSIQREENSLNIEQTSTKAIIHWEDFSIQENEITNISQPSKNACILNRVISANPSQIYGRLQSNGKIYLINENGVFIGPQGKITASTFLATTHKLDEEDFLNNKDLYFKETKAGQIVNDGEIIATSENIYLFAKEIRNNGLIRAENQANLISAIFLLLKVTDDDPNIYIKVKYEGSIENNGTIEAEKINIYSSNPYEAAINQNGILAATGAIKKNGRIFLVAEEGEIKLSGKISAKNKTTGGQIHVDAPYIYADNCVLDVSNKNQSGDISLGTSTNTKLLFVEKNVAINANSTKKGNAGNIYLASKDDLVLQGQINANSFVSGNGGFISIIADNPYIDGSISAKAKKGVFGNVLISPFDFVVASNLEYPAYSTNYLALSESFISAESMSFALNNAHVTISANQGVDSYGSVEFRKNFTWESPTNLIVQAKNIIVEEAIENLQNIASLELNSINGYVHVFNDIKLLGDINIKAKGAFSDAIVLKADKYNFELSARDIRLDGSSFSGRGVFCDGCSNIVSLSGQNILKIIGEANDRSSTGVRLNNVTINPNLADQRKVVITGYGSEKGLSKNSIGVDIANSLIYACNDGITINGFARSDGNKENLIGLNIEDSCLCSEKDINLNGNNENTLALVNNIGIYLGKRTSINSETVGGNISIFGVGAEGVLSYGVCTEIVQNNAISTVNGDISILGESSGSCTAYGLCMRSNNNLINDVKIESFSKENKNVTLAGKIISPLSGYDVFLQGANHQLQVGGNSSLTKIAGNNIYLKNIKMKGNFVTLAGLDLDIVSKIEIDANEALVIIPNNENCSLAIGKKALGDFQIKEKDLSKLSGNYSQLVFGDEKNNNQININTTYVFNKDVSIKGNVINLDSGFFAENNKVTFAISGNKDGIINLNDGVYASLFEINGGEKNDVFNFNMVLGQKAKLNGKKGFNTLSGPDIVNFWTITEQDQGILSSNSLDVHFKNIQNLIGGESADNFIFKNKAVLTGSVNGNSSFGNEIDFSNWSEKVVCSLSENENSVIKQGIANVQLLIGGQSTNDVLAGYEIGSKWYLTESNEGTINNNIAFVDFENYVGGATGADIFVMKELFSLDGKIDGNSNFGNTVDYSLFGANDDVYINLANSTATNIPLEFSNIQNFIGGSGSNKIYGPHMDTLWNITDTDKGNINNMISFQDFGHLIGGDEKNVFNMIFSDNTCGSLSEALDGGNDSKQNFLNYSFYNEDMVAINLLTGSAPNINAGNQYSIVNINTIITPNTDFQIIGNEKDNIFIISSNEVNGVIDGHQGKNIVVAPNTDNEWSINKTNAQLKKFDSDQNKIIAFENIEKLVGGNAIDHFVFNEYTSSIKIDGNAGESIVDLSKLVAYDGFDNFVNVSKIIPSIEKEETTLALQDPIKTEPVQTEPVQTGPVQTGPVQPDTVQPDTVQPDILQIELVLAEKEPVQEEHVNIKEEIVVAFEPVYVEPVKTEQIKPIQMDPIQMDPIQTKVVQTTPVETTFSQTDVAKEIAPKEPAVLKTTVAKQEQVVSIKPVSIVKSDLQKEISELEHVFAPWAFSNAYTQVEKLSFNFGNAVSFLAQEEESQEETEEIVQSVEEIDTDYLIR